MPGLHFSPRTLPPACLRILIADDDDMVRVALLGLLKRLGHEVFGVSNGLEAVEMAVARDFDIVMLDMQMPVMDGHEAADRIFRRPTRDLPKLVGLSAERMADVPATDVFDAFLLKPVRLIELNRLVDRLGPRALPDPA